jgi:hypothetical protein
MHGRPKKVGSKTLGRLELSYMVWQSGDSLGVIFRPVNYLGS